ncbi:MAG: response regulator [Treponema sp.]|jgi:putative two-component system response regulator|nr:response regulator [Treponema sp.]
MQEQPVKKIVMAVDDMPLNLAVIRNVLSGKYDVRPVKSAKVALEMLNTIKPDLVLLDIEMPEMSGIDFLVRMKSNPEHSAYKDIPVVFVTAHTTEDMITRIMSGGARDYIVKPFEPGTLLKKVGSLLDGKENSGG